MTDEPTVAAGRRADPAPAPGTKRAAKAAETHREALAYLGPNRPYDLPLMRNQVFKGSAPPAFCREFLKDRPHFSDCFVKVSGLAEALVQVKKADSALARAVEKVAAETVARRRAPSGGK